MTTPQVAAVYPRGRVYRHAVSAHTARRLSRRIAVLLRARMTDLGITQSDLAGLSGVSQTTVSRHVRTGQGLPVDTLDMYCQALGLEIAEVVSRASRE